MLFETRYFWALFTSNDGDVTRKLKELFDKSKKRYTSSITIYEVSKLTLASEGKTVAKLRTRTIENQFKVIEVDFEIAEQGADISHRMRIPMADALIAATAKKLNLVCVTDDPHFSEVKCIWI
jgi:predicted nucleic acid-binding protein